KVFCQLIGSWNFGAVEQNRNHWDSTLKCCPDLATYKIIGIVQTSAAVLIADVEPLVPDHGKQSVALADLFAQSLPEVDAEVDVIQVKEYFLSEFIHKPVANTPSSARTVLAAIANENFRHR